jgi:hypothetical protein
MALKGEKMSSNNNIKCDVCGVVVWDDKGLTDKGFFHTTGAPKQYDKFTSHLHLCEKCFDKYYSCVRPIIEAIETEIIKGVKNA